MKKIALLLAIVLMVSMCSFAMAASTSLDLREMNLKDMRLVYTYNAFNLTTEDRMSIFGFNSEETTILVPSYSELVAALQSGRADYTILPYITAQYLVKTDPDAFKLTVLPNVTMKMKMILRSEDAQLADAISGAIAELKENGKVYSLMETLVYGVDNVSEANAASEAKLFEGADTLYVGVSGELPPMDYVAADGQAAGFNVALVQEIAKILEKNVVFVVIPTEAKYQALLSQKIDVFFWQGGVFELPQDIIGTESYLATGLAIVAK